MKHTLFVTLIAATVAVPHSSAAAQSARAAATAPADTPANIGGAGVETPANYVIGSEDVLQIIFWRDKDMSGDVAVRPDGKISLPLLNDVQAGGLTPDQLRQSLVTAAGKFVDDPNVTVIVKTINSRKVYVTGNVNKPGPYPLSAPTTVLQLIATAGGVLEYAKTDKVVVMRTENGRTISMPFNYGDVMKGKKLQQNVLLKPGDTVIVP